MMTMEKAIERLEWYQCHAETKEDADAFDMAISALNQLNEPLTCVGCLWAEKGAFVKCSSCMRDKKDNYRCSPTKVEEVLKGV